MNNDPNQIHLKGEFLNQSYTINLNAQSLLIHLPQNITSDFNDI